MEYSFGGAESYIGDLINLITVIFPVSLIAWKADKKSNFVLRSCLCVAVMLAVVEAFTAFTNYIYSSVAWLQPGIIYIQILKYLSVFILSGVSVKLCFKCDWWGALFCATAGYCLQHISAKISSIFNDFILPEMHWAFTTLISVVVATAVYIVFYFLVLHRRKKRKILVENKWQVCIAACVVGVNIFYNSFGISYLSAATMKMESAGLDTLDLRLLLMFVYIMSLLTALLALALNLGISKNKHLSSEMGELKRIMEESKKQYEYEKSNIELINMRCHDLKYQLAAMKGKIYEEQIDELSEAINIYDSSVKTGNEALDIVLTQKSLYCKQHGIRLTFLLNGDNYKFIPHHEVYALFNNIINNAIEAVEQLPDEKRKISITERMMSGFVTVREENFYSGNLEIKDGLPVSTKNSAEHGLGIKSIKYIVEKNGGNICIDSDGETFTLDVYFCNPKA